MRRLTVWMSLFALSSCKFVEDWAAATTPVQDPGVDPTSTGPMLPTVGGSDPLDIVVTVLTVCGLPAVARLLMLAKPLVSPLVRMLWPKPAAKPPVPPAPTAVP